MHISGRYVAFIWIKFSIQRNDLDVSVVILPAQENSSTLSVVVEVYANIV